MTRVKPDTDVAGPSLSRSVLMFAVHAKRDDRVSDRPARIPAATHTASITCSSEAPLIRASRVCEAMLYGHWVTCATATEMSCLVNSSNAREVKTASLELSQAL